MLFRYEESRSIRATASFEIGKRLYSKDLHNGVGKEIGKSPLNYYKYWKTNNHL